MLALVLAIGGCLPVEGDRILLRDLAPKVPAFEGANESIGFAPAPGAQRRLSPGELQRLAARKGVTAEFEPVCFERKMQTLTEGQVIAALRASLPEGAQLELIEFSRTQVPNGTLEFTRSGLTPTRSGAPKDPVIWRGRVKYSTKQSVPVWAKVRVWISHPAPVAAQDLPAGKPIRSEQVRMDSINASPFSSTDIGAVTGVTGGAGDSPAPPTALVGLTPRRTIRAGQVVSRLFLDTPLDVTRGEMIGVEARYGAAFLKFEARAEASGRMGDSVVVRNVESGKTFRARVVRKGLVAVAGYQPAPQE